MKGYIENIEKITLQNNNFRKVLFTGQHAQLVIMSLKPNEEIGEETHEVTDQFIRVEAGIGKIILDGEEHVIHDGDAMIVPAGVKHNVINTSDVDHLKLYTIYSPPHHKDGTVHATKKDAMTDHEDHL